MSEFNPFESGNILDSHNLPDYKVWEESGYGDKFYYIRGHDRVSAINAFNEYIFTSFGNYIYYINENTPVARPLEGTYAPEEWKAETAYKRGDIVSPTDNNYNGYVYMCVNNTGDPDETFTSGDTEPTWEADLSTIVEDGDVNWRGVGSLEAEGNSAKDLHARCLALYKGFLFLGNTIENGENYQSRIRWSQWQNPRLWHNNEDGSGMAGYVDVDDISGQILNIKVLGDALYIYKENGIVSVTYTGGEDTIFSKEVVTTRAGLFAQDAIIELPHNHIFVGQDNIYIFDGNTCTPIGDSIKDWFFQQVDVTRAYRMFGYYEQDTNDVIIAFSSIKNKNRRILNKQTEDCDLAIVYNISYRTWSIREMYMTAAGKYRMMKDKVIDDIEDTFDSLSDTRLDSGVYSKNTDVSLVGDQLGYFYIKGGYADLTHKNYTQNDGTYDGYVVSKTHHMDAPDKVKRLLRIQFHIQTQGDFNMYVQVGYGWNAETEQMQWTDKQYLNLHKPTPWYTNSVAPFIDLDLSARYFQIKFGTDGANEPFKILGYTIQYQIRSEE